jgi:hypothetical protein
VWRGELWLAAERPIVSKIPRDGERRIISRHVCFFSPVFIEGMKLSIVLQAVDRENRPATSVKKSFLFRS